MEFKLKISRHANSRNKVMVLEVLGNYVEVRNFYQAQFCLFFWLSKAINSILSPVMCLKHLVPLVKLAEFTNLAD